MYYVTRHMCVALHDTDGCLLDLCTEQQCDTGRPVLGTSFALPNILSTYTRYAIQLIELDRH